MNIKIICHTQKYPGTIEYINYQSMNKARAYTAFIRHVLLIVSCTWIVSCSDTPEQPLRIGTNLWPGYEPLYLARHKGYLDEHIRLVEYPSATEVLRAFRNHSLEAACLTLDEALLLRQYDMPISIILVTDISHGGDAIIARSGIENVQQLAGKTVAVETGALGAYLITRALELNDMSLKQVEIRHMSVDNHKSAFDNGNIDAVVTFDPVRTQLLASGANEIFNSRDIPGEIVDVMVVSSTAVKQHEEQITRVIQGWFRALNDLRDHANESAQFISQRQKISAEQVLKSYQAMKLPSPEENMELLGGPSPQLQDNIRRMSHVMKRQQLLEPDILIGELLTDRFIQNVEK